MARLTLGPAVLLAVAFFALPVGLVLAEAFAPGGGHFGRLFGRPVYLSVTFNTLEVAAFVATACVLVGYPMAYFVVTRPPALRPVLLFLVLVPMWMSVLVRSYAWMVVLGREGVVNQALLALGLVEAPVTLLFNGWAVRLAMVQILLPVAVIVCHAAMTEIDPGLIRAARVMGATPLAAFRRVFLPLSLDGAVTAWSVIFILSVGFFIVPMLLGGRRDAMLGTMIVTQVGQANWGLAAAMAILLLAITLAVLAAVRLVSRGLLHSARAEG
jgi:putative spermidine/putrescine transport system permease protein